MARVGKGAVVVRKTKRGQVFALRFSAYGERHYYTLGYSDEGWNREKAETELSNVLADARRGIWQPPTQVEPERPERMPTFAEYAATWLDVHSAELADSTTERARYSLRHLNATFGDKPLDSITVGDVDRYKAAKLVEGTLSADSTNKTLKLMSQILDYAVEDDQLLERNVAKGKRRRLKTGKPRRTWLDTADQIEALLNATAAIDRRLPWSGFDRAALATMMFAGLRIGELLDLKRRDVDLASGRVRVGRAKTDAGQRDVNILPVLRDDLSAYLAERDLAPNAYVFGGKTGKRGNESNIRERLLKPSVEVANAALIENELTPMSDQITPHSLRRTFASILVALGEDPAYVMSQLGHTDPAFTLRVYTQVMGDRSGERERIREVVGASDLALAGTKDAQSSRGNAVLGTPDSGRSALRAA